jgi:hypothetical protein
MRVRYHQKSLAGMLDEQSLNGGPNALFKLRMCFHIGDGLFVNHPEIVIIDFLVVITSKITFNQSGVDNDRFVMANGFGNDFCGVSGADQRRSEDEIEMDMMRLKKTRDRFSLIYSGFIQWVVHVALDCLLEIAVSLTMADEYESIHVNHRKQLYTIP